MNTRILVPMTLLLTVTVASADPVVPHEVAQLFNGKDLTGFTTWLKDAKRQDPRKVFTVSDGMIHVSGDGFGYLATEKDYRDYRLIVEYKWGKRTDGGKYVRNSGVLVHASGPDGNHNGTFMASIECQLAQGCVGDLIVIGGKDANGKVIPVALKAETVLGPDKHPRWKKGGPVRAFTQGHLWWSLHDPNYTELLDSAVGTTWKARSAIGPAWNVSARACVFRSR